MFFLMAGVHQQPDQSTWLKVKLGLVNLDECLECCA